MCKILEIKQIENTKMGQASKGDSKWLKGTSKSK